MAGAYTSPPLVLGTYTVKVELAGFKIAESGDILLRGGDQIRNDVAMQVGGLEETVQVTGRTGLDATQPDVAHTVDQKYYEDLPFVTGSDVRLAESVLLMQPGYLPMRPNGDPMFRGSQFNSRINGGQTRATENFFDGAAFGYSSGHQQSHESTPPVESIQEVKVISTTYSAQYGHTSGGFISYTSKSGTNKYRGSIYEYFADDAFNGNNVFSERTGIPKSPIRNDNPGFTLGGPLRLPGYNGLNKTHFFTNFDYTRIRSGTIAGFGNTTPIDAFKNGDFSGLLTGRQIGVDALGRPLLEGQIFDPGTTREVNGISVRDPFPNNVIPANHPLRSQVASRVIPLMVRPDREGTRQQRGRRRHRETRRGSWMRGTSCSASITASRRTSAPTTASTGTAVRRSATAKVPTGATTTPILRSSRPRIPTTTAAGSFNASRPTTPTSSSTGSSRTTC